MCVGVFEGFFGGEGFCCCCLGRFLERNTYAYTHSYAQYLLITITVVNPVVKHRLEQNSPMGPQMGVTLNQLNKFNQLQY